MSDAEISQIFDKIDVDHDLKIDEVELKEFLAHEGFDLTHEALRNMIVAADENNDGKISRNEFLHMCKKLIHQSGGQLARRCDKQHTPKVNGAPVVGFLNRQNSYN